MVNNNNANAARHVYSVKQGREIRGLTDNDIRNELASAPGRDFFALVDADFLLPLFSAWQNADKEEEERKRNVFVEELNLALDRAIKRKRLKGIIS